MGGAVTAALSALPVEAVPAPLLFDLLSGVALKAAEAGRPRPPGAAVGRAAPH